LKLLLIFEVKSWSEDITILWSLSKPLIPPHFSTQTQDMCHGTIGSGMVEIEFQPYQDYSIV